MSGIIRIEKNKDYSVISNIPANDERLSWEARGVLFYLLTKPDGWQCRNRDLINKGPAGGDKIERILDELQEHGYVTRTRIQRENGLFDWETIIHEIPVEPKPEIRARIEKKKATAIEKRKRRKEKSTIGVLSTNGSTTNGKHPDIVITDLVNNKLIESPTKNKLPDEEPEPGPFTQELLKLCKINYRTATDRLKRTIAKTVKTLGENEVSKIGLQQFSIFWQSNWRSKDGSPPTLNQVCELWGEFEAWQKQPAAATIIEHDGRVTLRITV